MTPLILWDWDNTLADTFPVILKAQHTTQRHFGLPLISEERAKLSMNQDSLTIFENLVGKKDAPLAMDYFWDIYQKYSADLQLKAGAFILLELTHQLGFINVLGSNKEEFVLLREVENLNVKPFFDRIVGATEGEEKKPNPQFLQRATQGFTYNLLICIGDRQSDVRLAHNTPKGIAVLVGSNPDSPEFEKDKPDYTCENINAVKDLLTEIFQ